MKKGLLSIFAMAVLMLVSVIGNAQTTYTKVNSVSELEAGAQYILVGYDNDGAAFVMGYQKPNNRHALAIDEVGGVITATVATDPTSQTDPFEFTLGGSAGAWTIFDPLNNGYLYAAGGGNYLKTQSTLDDKGQWTITDSADGGMVPVSNGGVEQCYMRYNITSTLFGCYKESSNVAATVYFFKAGGAATPDPEPTNYPTNFAAAVDGLSVTLNWTDATGTQLPHKYLVVGSTGNITVPTDGTPVANGELTANVNYGVQTVTFSGLTSGTTYHFAIFPYTNGGANIDYKTDGTYPTANATTEEFFLFEDFNDGLGQFAEYSVTGEQVWHQGTYQGTTYANMNGYANGGANENEDWLISPQLFLGSDLVYNWMKLEFSTAKKFEGNAIEVLISNDYAGQGDPNNATWDDITDAFDYSTGDYEWVASGAYDILSMVSDGFYLAFRYTSTTEGAASWEIDFVKITADYQVSVAENAVAQVNVAPNPVCDEARFTLEQQAQVTVYDLSGRMVADCTMSAGANRLDVARLESGVYFLNVRYNDGRIAVTRFVKF